MSTVSASTIPMVPIPIEDKYIITELPMPPAPMANTLEFLSLTYPLNPISDNMIYH